MAGSDHRVTRLLLLVGCFAGLTAYILTPIEQPAQVMLATDVYRHAVGAFLDGGNLYGNPPPDRPGYNFLYPPITVLAFVPHAMVGSLTVAFVLQTILNLVAVAGTGVIIHRALARRDIAVTHFDLLLIWAFFLLSTYGAIQFLNGQINLWLALAFAIGFDAIDRDKGRLAGIAFAIAALFKVFPAILGLWLLRLRTWNAVVAAIATGVSGLALGALFFGPELTITYLTDVLLGRFEGSTYEGQPEPSDSVDGIHRQLAALWPGGSAYHSLIGFLIVATLLAAAMIDVSEQLNRDAAALATIVAILLYLPVQPLYFPLITFPLFMLLYSELPTVPRRLLVGGTLLTFIHIQQEAVDLWLAWLPLPSGLATGIETLTASLFTVILPPTLGLWIMLFACILIQHDSLDLGERRKSSTISPA